MKEKTALDYLQDWLDNYINYERVSNPGTFSLNTIRFLCDRFHHPERDFQSFHIAGSKGKGSVSCMVASILHEAGLKEGLYTSPHILNFKERIGTSVSSFSEEIYEKAARILIPLTESIIPDQIPGGNEPSWFELITMYAFLCFKASQIEWGVFETGMGGRLDATNVLLPVMSIITVIELEHTEYLGDTLEKIAGEKAGIIKKNTPVCIAAQTEQVKDVFRKKAAEENAPVYFIDEVLSSSSCNLSSGGMNIRLNFGPFSVPGNTEPLFKRPISTELRLIGRIQTENAALAALAIKYIFPSMDESVIERGLSHAYLPGRFEIIPGFPVPVIVDGAHTVRSIQLTLETFFNLWQSPAQLLFACAIDKQVDLIANMFAAGFSRIIVTKPGIHKKTDLNKVREAFNCAIAETNTQLLEEPDFRRAAEISLEEAVRTNQPLLVTGSFYLVAEFKKILSESKVFSN